MSPAKKNIGKRKIPQRTCVICRERHPKRKLIRIVRTPDSGSQIDLTGKAAGRGAYLCKNPGCWEKAAKGKALEHALKTTFTDDERQMILAQGQQLGARIGVNNDI